MKKQKMEGKMKKLGFIVLCLLVFAGTLFIFLPDNTSAEAWYCYWYPYKDCTDEGGIVVVTQCDTEECDHAGGHNQVCVYCLIEL